MEQWWSYGCRGNFKGGHFLSLIKMFKQMFEISQYKKKELEQ